jgi:hypothetical protein
MMPSPAIYTYSDARHSRWFSASTAQARVVALHSIAVARPILSRYPLMKARSTTRDPISTLPFTSTQSKVSPMPGAARGADAGS